MVKARTSAPQGSEKAGESAKERLAELIRQYEDDPEAIERIYQAGLEAAEQTEEYRMEEGPDSMRVRALALQSFMQHSGISRLLASTPEERMREELIGITPAPINEDAPVEIGQEDFDALFGSAIHRRRPKEEVHGYLIAVSVLVRTPDGKIYQLTMRKDDNGEYRPFEYMETDLESLKAAKELSRRLRGVAKDTRGEVSDRLI